MCQRQPNVNMNQLISDWKNKFQQVVYNIDNIVDTNQKLLAFTILPPNLTQYIFTICEELKQPLTVKFLSVDVFKIFFHRHFISLDKHAKENAETKSEFEKNWEMIFEQTNPLVVLRIMSCIEIASKMVDKGICLTGKRVARYLVKLGSEYSLKIVNASEFRVFQIIGFKLPRWSILEAVYLLVQLVTVRVGSVPKEELMEVSSQLLEMVYLEETKLYNKIASTIAHPDRDYPTGAVRFIVAHGQLLVAASIVYCAGHIMRTPDTQAAQLLSALTDEAQVSADDVRVIADNMFLMMLEEV